MMFWLSALYQKRKEADFMACPFLDNGCDKLKNLDAGFFQLRFTLGIEKLVEAGVTSSGSETVIEDVCKKDNKFMECPEFQRRQSYF